MAEKKTQTETKQSEQHDMYCPFCFLMKTLKESKTKHHEFCQHIYNAQIELLQAFKTLIDTRISSLEKRKKEVTTPKKATRIKVE